MMYGEDDDRLTAVEECLTVLSKVVAASQPFPALREPLRDLAAKLAGYSEAREVTRAAEAVDLVIRRAAEFSR